METYLYSDILSLRLICWQTAEHGRHKNGAEDASHRQRRQAATQIHDSTMHAPTLCCYDRAAVSGWRGPSTPRVSLELTRVELGVGDRSALPALGWFHPVREGRPLQLFRNPNPRLHGFGLRGSSMSETRSSLPCFLPALPSCGHSMLEWKK